MKKHSVFWPFDRFWTEAERWIQQSGMSVERAMGGTRVTETDREVIAVVEIPGLCRRHDLDIRAVEGRLVIRGKTGSERSRDGGNRPAVYQRSEMSFFVALPLPSSADASRMKTELKGNVLIVRFPKGPRVN